MRRWMAVFDTLDGVSACIGKHRTAGETDWQVAPATFDAVPQRDPSDNELSSLNAQYLLHLADNVVVPPGCRPLSGVEKVLLQLKRPGLVLGLDFEFMDGSAQTKFSPANHNRLFVSQARGSDSPDRIKIRGRVLSEGLPTPWMRRTVRNSAQVALDTLKLHRRLT